MTTCHYKNLSASTAKLLIFLDRDAKTQPKTPLFRPQVSNFGAQDYFQVLVTFINRRFRQVALSDPGPAQLMHGLLDDAKTELKVQIKNLVEQHARHVVQGEESPNDRMALQAAA
ncbi:MAG: hypothetical protein EBU47_12735 [Betaproteobacteria bacterium]|nr:hypothetical protein [Betaproteobacteria bacterium]